MIHKQKQKAKKKQAIKIERTSFYKLRLFEIGQLNPFQFIECKTCQLHEPWRRSLSDRLSKLAITIQLLFYSDNIYFPAFTMIFQFLPQIDEIIAKK